MKFVTRKFIVLLMLISAYSININASLSVFPEGIKDTIPNGENKTTVLYITNSTGVLSYQLSTDDEWIEFSSISGDINAGDTVSVSVTFNTALLNGGINTSNIYIGDPHHGPITIPVEVYLQGGVTGVKENLVENNPTTFSLNQNYPNPFNPVTNIQYVIARKQFVTIKIYNVLGNEIATLVNEEKEKGVYSINVNMSMFSSGVYFYNLKAGNYVETKKMILNK